MADMMDTLFGPLSSEFCIYFYYLSILGFILLALLLVTTLFIGITKRKGSDFYLHMFTVAIGYAIFYFQNRLLHSMCIR